MSVSPLVLGIHLTSGFAESRRTGHISTPPIRFHTPVWKFSQVKTCPEHIISAELLPLTQTKDLSDTASRRMKALTDEGIDLAAEKETYQKALTYAGSADPYPSGEPADAANWGLPKLKTFGHPNAPRVAPQSPLQLDDQQTHALWQAARNKTPFRCEIGHKGLEHGTSFRSKAALTESGLNNQLPAIQVPGPRGNYGIPYEPFRVLSALPTVAMTGPSAAYLSHTGNTNEAAGVAEAGTKPDLGPIVTESFIKPQKIAGTVTATLEILQDHEEFAAFLPTELARSVYNQESLYLLQANYSGGPTSTAFTGLLGISGTLSRAVGTDTPLDALNKSFVDLRTGSAFCEPDAIIVAPQTLSALRRQKDANGRYLLDLISGPATINQTAEQTLGRRGHTGDPLYGIRRITRTRPQLLSARQHHRLTGVLDTEEHIAVKVAHVIYQKIIAAYAHQRTARSLTTQRPRIPQPHPLPNPLATPQRRTPRTRQCTLNYEAG